MLSRVMFLRCDVFVVMRLCFCFCFCFCFFIIILQMKKEMWLWIYFRFWFSYSQICLLCWNKCYQKITIWWIVVMRQKRYYVQWVWSRSKYLHVLMVAYYTWKSMKIWINVRNVVGHATSWRTTMVMTMIMLAWSALLLECYGTCQYFQGSKTFY